MARKIGRRQLLRGLGGMAIAPVLVPRISRARSAPASTRPGYYPPAATGIRGNHDGADRHMHYLRDGKTAPGTPQDIGEHYDLVIVGAGISGLAAAYFHQQRAAGKARILVLDNHDDFGGNARRNEFSYRGQTYIGYAGSQSLNSSSMGPVVDELLSTLRIDFQEFHQAYDKTLYAELNLRNGVYFNSRDYGEDRLVRGAPFVEKDHKYMIESYDFDAESFVSKTPLSEQGKKDLFKLFTTKQDYFEEKSFAAKKQALDKISYANFLRNHVQVSEEIVSYYESKTLLRGLGASSFPAGMAMSMGLPGFDGMKPEPDAKPKEPYIYHFPDGNGSVPRLILNHFIPDLAPDRDPENVLTAKFDYEKLDRPAQSLRVRLNSTVTNVTDRREHVAVTYAGEQDSSMVVTANQVVLACPHAVIPYICPTLPGEQKQAMSQNVRVPVVYANVLLRQWESFTRAGVSTVYCPGSFYHEVSLDYPVSMGAYEFSRDPQKPVIIHMEHIPYSVDSALTARQHYRRGRYQLLATSLEEFEQEARSQLGSMLGPFGFDSARDILDMTFNRWAHGASYIYNGIFDDRAELDETRATARRPFGRITIANADAGPTTSLDTAVNEAYRAVSELWD